MQNNLFGHVSVHFFILADNIMAMFFIFHLSKKLGRTLVIPHISLKIHGNVKHTEHQNIIFSTCLNLWGISEEQKQQ